MTNPRQIAAASGTSLIATLKEWELGSRPRPKAGDSEPKQFAQRGVHKPQPNGQGISLERQLEALGARPEMLCVTALEWLEAEPWMSGYIHAVSRAQIAWDRQRSAIMTDIQRRDARRLRDRGPNESGNFDVSPYQAAKGHVVEEAPRHLKANGDSGFPRRITTQRMIDRYLARGEITRQQWRAADRLWKDFVRKGGLPGVTADYNPVFVDGSGDPERQFIGRASAADDYFAAAAAMGRNESSCLRFVVIEDGAVGAWATAHGASARASGSIGMFVLRTALDGLIEHYGFRAGGRAAV